MSDFKYLCKAKYGKVSHGMELVNLTVFARNGDRAPDDIEESGWKKRMCVKCNKTECTLKHCTENMLTVKGYKQGHDLAAFIKQEYYPRFHKKNTGYINDRNNLLFPRNTHLDLETVLSVSPEIDIGGYYYKKSKNHVFLKSILHALEYSNAKMSSIKPLGSRPECEDLRSTFFSKKDTEKLGPSVAFKRIIGSLCNDVPINCNKFDCDLIKIEDYLVQEKMNIEDSLAKMGEDFIASAIGFAEISKFILENSTKHDMAIVSVDAETILDLLAGLNIRNTDLVPYGSAVFVELWRDPAGNQFYSINYNGQQMKFGLFKEEFVQKEEFEKFLGMFSKRADKIRKVCEYKAPDFDKDSLMYAKIAEMKKIFTPLVTTLYRKGILAKEIQ